MANGNESTQNRVKISPYWMSPIGQSGLNRWNGNVDEEWLPELQGREGMRRYREMAEGDAIVGAMLYAIEQILRTTSWTVERGGDSNLDHEKAEFLKSCMEDTSHTWSDFISEVLSMLPYGWAYTEITYKQRLGDHKDSRKRSRFNDGRIGWRSLAIRAQTTLDQWDFDEDGGVNGWWQIAPPDNKRVYLPMEKGLLFRTKLARNNPEGMSVLRTAYEAYYYRKNLRQIEAIGIERNLVGLPVIYAPMELFAEDASPDHKAVLDYLRQMATNIRMDEQSGIVMPRDPANKDAFAIELLSHRGRSSINDAVSGPIQRYSQEIAMSVLADVILLGHGQVGSYALSSTKTDLFGHALNAYMDSIQQVLNRYAVPRLFRFNTFPETERLPMFKHGNVMVPDLKELGQYVYHLARAGMKMFPDLNIENELLRVANLPERVPGQEAEEGDDQSPPDTPDDDVLDFDPVEIESRVLQMVESRIQPLESQIKGLASIGGDE